MDETVKARNWITAVADVLKASKTPTMRYAGGVVAGANYNVEFAEQVALAVSESLHAESPNKVGGSEEDNMAAGIAVGFFRAAAEVMREKDMGLSDVFDEFAADHAFCLAVAKKLMEDADG